MVIKDNKLDVIEVYISEFLSIRTMPTIQETVKSVTTRNEEPVVIKELTVQDDVGNVCVTMWNDIATRSVTTPQKQICIKNSICDFSTLKRQIVTKVNKLDAIEIYGDKSPSI